MKEYYLPEFVPEEAIRVADEVIKEGQKKHGDRWKGRESVYYIERAAVHIDEWCDGDESEDHLSHAMTDLILAIALRERGK